VATSVSTSGTTTIAINSVAGVTSTTTLPLISYTGADPFSSFTLAPLTGGFSGTLVDNSANNRIDLQVTPPAVNPNPTNIVVSVSGGVLTLSWPKDHTGWTLQTQTNTLATGIHTTNWFDIPGSSTTNVIKVPIDRANGTVFYRMILSP
jgi:hypothetical protein